MMNILTNFVTSVNCKTDLGVFLDTIPFLGDAASSRVAQGGPSLRDGHSQLSHRIKKSGAREKSEWKMTF